MTDFQLPAKKNFFSQLLNFSKKLLWELVLPLTISFLKLVVILVFELTKKIKDRWEWGRYQLGNVGHIQYLKYIITSRPKRYIWATVADIAIIVFVVVIGIQPAARLISPLVPQKLHSLTSEEAKGGKEVFGFAPYWTIDKLENVNWDVLTTLAYFSIEIDSFGNLIKDDPGYQTFKSQKATRLFQKAHSHGTKVVLTITQMDNASIRSIMDDESAQKRLIEQTVAEVKDRGIDGINVDFEYSGNPGQGYRNKFTKFIASLTNKMHDEVPNSKISVAAYASAVKEPKIYDLVELGKLDIQMFMMAYDFGYRGSENAIPTAPLYGYKDGKYWYDVSTAVEDFIALMPAEKLILGTPWYGYNYPIVGAPNPKAPTLGYGSRAETYSIAMDNIKPDMEGITDYKEGWDDIGKVSWKAYKVASTGSWRMIFIEDRKSLEIKYDYAKDKNLGGVGIWALGFDDGKNELWGLLASKFGNKFADASVREREIRE